MIEGRIIIQEPSAGINENASAMIRAQCSLASELNPYRSEDSLDPNQKDTLCAILTSEHGNDAEQRWSLSNMGKRVALMPVKGRCGIRLIASEGDKTIWITYATEDGMHLSG